MLICYPAIPHDVIKRVDRVVDLFVVRQCKDFRLKLLQRF